MAWPWYQGPNTSLTLLPLTSKGLIALYTAMNLPLVIWMMRSFLADLPYETLEAARMDGATLFQELTRVVLPLAMPGLMATLLLCFIWRFQLLERILGITDNVRQETLMNSRFK